MIGRITGTLIEKLPPTICVDVNGLGYDIEVPMSTLYALPELGARVTLHTHLTVREYAHILYGFATAAERGAFRELRKA
ncbi:Holliday junction branch migration protein RuvA, partial [Pseudomonas stutzeri]|nr:Holliday junction branch migration protein RuvA [Stutzerimonas stutzeri]